MSEYRLEPFGMFDGSEIEAIVDSNGEHWFTQELMAAALGVDRTTVGRLRTHYPAEFTEFVDWNSIVWEGRRRIVFSEEGFMTACDMANSETAFRLRRWMRKQFKVRRHANTLVIQAKSMPDEDLSDLPENMQMTRRLWDDIASNYRRIAAVKKAQELLKLEQTELKERVTEQGLRLAAIENTAQIKPGEMTATQLAGHAGWLAKSGAPHNSAIILAAYNQRFHERGLIVKRNEKQTTGIIVEVCVFTPDGVSAFKNEIDSQYALGEKFTITPNSHALAVGQKNKRHVMKGQSNSWLLAQIPSSTSAP